MKTKKKIEDLIQTADVLGTGFIPIDEKNWWFAVGNKKYWKRQQNNELMISFTAIGGHVEKGESILDATLREIQEETGTKATIYQSDDTLFITADLQEKPVFNFQIKTMERIEIEANPKPRLLYVVQREHDKLGVVVYQGRFQSEPSPQMEVPALICLPPDLLTKTPLTLSKLLSLGAKIKEQYEEIPRDSILYSFGSAKILQAFLNKKKVESK